MRLRPLLLFALALLLCLGVGAEARQKIQGVAGQSGTILTSGVTSTTRALKTFPSATITVYIAGTTDLATIYADEAGTPKSNPFTAGTDATYSFYAPNGLYDIRFSGGTVPNNIATPFTIGDVLASDPVEVYNVRNFGGVCDGTTDRSVQIGLAAAAAEGSITIGKGTLYFPKQAGACILRDVEIPAYVEVTGPGLLKLPSNMTSRAVMFNVTGSHTAFRNLNIDGNKGGQPLTAGGIPSLVAGYAECECYQNLGLAGAGSVFWAGISADGVTTPDLTDIVVEGCDFRDMYGTSVVTTNVNYPRVERNTTDSSYRSLADLYGGTATVLGVGAIVRGNFAKNILRYNAFLLTGWDGAVFTGNILRNVDRGMKVESGRNYTLSSNQYNQTNTDYCDLTWAGLCASTAGPAIQLTSNQTSCGYFQADGITPQCGLRNVTMDDNHFTRSGGIGASVGAGGIVGLSITASTFDSLSTTSSLWAIVITQTDVSYTAYRVLIADITGINLPYRAIDVGTASGLTITGCHLNGGAGASQGVALNPAAAVLGVAPTMENISITDTDLTSWSPTGGALVVFDNTDSTVSYVNLQIKGVNCNQGATNVCLRMDLDTAGSAASNYVAAGSSVIGNTFIGNVRVPQDNITWRNNVVPTKLNNALDAIGGATTSDQALTNYISVTPGVINANTCYTTTVTVANAKDGDTVLLGVKTAGAGVTGVVWTGYVSANDTVTLKACNVTTSNSASVAATAVKVRVEKNVN